MNQLKEKCIEHNMPLSMAFVDYKKTFDSVDLHSVLEALLEQGINSNYIKLIREIYTDNFISICFHKNSNKIKIKKGARQGDTM